MKKIIFFIIFILVSFEVLATHNRAGEITYRFIKNLTYEVTITTYTYAPSLADRCELDVDWGDGQTSTLPRSNGPNGTNPNNQYCNHLGIEITSVLKMNQYTGRHTYSSPGIYIISLTDPNRNAGIVNIPNSVNVVFYIKTTLVINPFLGPVNSPVLLNAPIDNGCVGKPFIHNPGAYDADGDSLSYELAICKGDGGQNIPGYAYPETSKTFKLDPITGDLVWDSPKIQGEYNVAMNIIAWRHGVIVSSVERDMQINILACNNNPPTITAINDTCIIAGTDLNFKVTAKDPDGNTVTLTASGGPFEINQNPATFRQSVYAKDSVSSIFNWKTDCSHVRKNPWEVVFRAVDNGSPVNLVALKTLLITIVAPAIQNLTATPSGNSILLKWDKSTCSNAVGYKIYRNLECKHLEPSNCETGVSTSTGYLLIGQNDDINNTTFTDNNNGKGLEHGITYGYTVTSYLSDTSSAQGVESLPSKEACASLIKDVPVITNVSIDSTDNTNGTAYIAWTKPTQLDTNKIHGPFRYLIYRTDGINNSLFKIRDSVNTLNDTIYNDSGLNTRDHQYYYRIDLYSVAIGKRLKVGSTTIASSVFLTIQPTAHEVILSWNASVPWINNQYVIYRKTPKSSQFDSLTTVSSSQVPVSSFNDKGLTNGAEYCYYIKTIGKYSEPDIVHPIINLSEHVCAVPVDNVSPCPPHLSIKSFCDARKENILTWTDPNHSCAKDVVKYIIWFSQTNNGDFSIIQTTSDFRGDTTFTQSGLNTIAGCYAVMAVDSFNNKSKFSNIVCVDIDSCSLYKLPNVFTPNNDGINDTLKPFRGYYVQGIEMKIYNRWGLLVYKTNDPEINWDGKDINSHKECSDGVYFYICTVYEQRLKGLTSRNLNGTVTIIR